LAIEIDLDALVVGPEEVLILRSKGEIEEHVLASVSEALERVGLGGRTLIMSGVEWDLAKVSNAESGAVPGA